MQNLFENMQNKQVTIQEQIVSVDVLLNTFKNYKLTYEMLWIKDMLVEQIPHDLEDSTWHWIVVCLLSQNVSKDTFDLTSSSKFQEVLMVQPRNLT